MLNSKELYDKIENLRKSRELTVPQLNRLAGISHGTLNAWKTRGTMPTLELLDSLCFALKYPLPSLLYDVDVDKLTGDEVELLSYWKKLNNEEKEAFLHLLTITTKGRT